jgi:hypothetical protein
MNNQPNESEPNYEKYLIECELENQKYMGISFIKKSIYSMKDKDFLLYYYNNYIKDISFIEFKKKYKTKKDIEKLKIKVINIEIRT